MTRKTTYAILALATLATAACGVGEAREMATTDAARRTPAGAARDADPERDEALVVPAVDTLLPTVIPADGIAAPVREAMLSTKLMATVTEVLVQEGDLVRVGQLLARLDARDVQAKAEQVGANVAATTAAQATAAAHAARMRALHADDAAPKAMLEAAELQLAQAEAALRAATAAGAELQAIGSYAEIRAPFAGRVTARFVDPGAFAAPGAPIVTVQDARTLRITAHVTPDAAHALRAGQRIEAAIEGVPATARIEGVVPAAGGLHAVNALVDNADGAHLAGSAASLRLARGTHRVVAIPADAVTRTGDLTGVTVRTDAGDTRRWVRLGATAGELVEVTSGLRAGERVVRRGMDGGR